MSALWFSGLKGMRHLNRFEFLMLSIPLGMVILPILSLVFILAPWSKVRLQSISIDLFYLIGGLNVNSRLSIYFART